MTDFKFKILLLGEAAVGKTSVLHRYVNNEFNRDYSATIGVKFLTKELDVKLDKKTTYRVLLNLWDVAGQPRFEDLRTTFYAGAGGALFIFDLTRRETYEQFNVWRAETARVLDEEIRFILIGNKFDLIKELGRQIKTSEAQALADSKNSIYIETSALTGKNIDKAFEELARMIVQKELGIELPKKKIKKATKKKLVAELIVKSKVREFIKSKGCNASKAIVNGPVLNGIITDILDRAIERSLANGRKTVQPRDL